MARFKCDNCTRAAKCRGPIGPTVHGGDLLILGEAPGDDEEAVGDVFVGRPGQYQARFLRHVTNSYILANACCCYSGANKPTPKQLEACADHWRALVVKHKPKVIMAMGGYAASAVLGRKVKISADVGQSLQMEIGGHRVLVLLNYHPAYILRMQEKKGGESERAERAWVDVWESLGHLLERGLDEPPKVVIMTRAEQACAYLRGLLARYKGIIAYDYETAGDGDARRPELCRDFRVLCVGLGTAMGGAAFLLDKMDSKAGIAEVEREWVKVIRLPYERLVAQNVKYEHKCNLHRFGFASPAQCTMLKMNAISETASAKLESVAHWAGVGWIGYKLENKDVQEHPDAAPIGRLLRYGGLDGLATYLSNVKLDAALAGEGQASVADHGAAYALHLAHVEMDGMAVDGRATMDVRGELQRELERTERAILADPAVVKVERWASKEIKSWRDGDHFNPGSPVQMQRLCLNALRLPISPDRRGDISLDKKALAKFEEDVPLIGLLLKSRSIRSMFTGFLDKYKQFTGPEGRVHTNYNQTIVVTGRLSSTDPNLQNIPKGSPVERVFVSRWKGGSVVSADYSQLEPRILAGWSGDEGMIDAFRNNRDLHLFVAARLAGFEYEDLLAMYKRGEKDAKRHRKLGKAMNLGTMYGQTAYGLSEHTDLDEDEAQELIDEYARLFPGVAKFRAHFEEMATRLGYVEDLLGRRRHLPNAQSDTSWERNRAYRQAGNMPVQSTGNQFCLISLCVARMRLAEARLEAVISGAVHDSLRMETSARHLIPAIRVVRDAMLIHNEQDYWKDRLVPLKVDIEAGPNLAGMRPVVA